MSNFVAFLRTYITCMASLVVRSWNMKRKLHLVFSESFLIFPWEFVRIFSGKKGFLKKVLQYLKFSAFSVHQNDAYHLKSEEDSAMGSVVIFDEGFYSEWTFAKVMETKFSLGHVDYSNDFPSCCLNNKGKLGFVKSIGLAGKAVTVFLEYARL